MTLVLPFGVAATVVSASFWTYAATRLGLGRLLAWSVVASAAALLCCALAPGYWVIVGMAVVFGLSAGAIDSALNAYAARHFGPRRINQMHAAFGLGAATSPLIVTTLIGAGASWRWAYAVVMVVQTILAVSFAATARHWDAAAYQPEPTATTPARSGTATMPRWWQQRRAMGGVLVIVVESGLESVVGLWAFVFLLERCRYRPWIAGPRFSGYWVGIVVGRILLGSLAERLGPWPVLAGSRLSPRSPRSSWCSAAGARRSRLGRARAGPRRRLSLLVLTTADGRRLRWSTVWSDCRRPRPLSFGALPDADGRADDDSPNAFAVGALVLT